MTVDTVILEKQLKAEFNRAYDQYVANNAYAKLFAAVATEVPSGADREKYGFLGDIPSVKELVGDVTIGALQDYDYTIINKLFYSGISVDRNELKDDQMGILNPRIQMMVQRLRSYQGKLIANLIINGTSGLAYDASAFFANRTSPNDNLLAGTGVTVATIQADIYSARAAMLKFQSNTGEVLGLEMDTVVVPPELEGPMMEAVFSPEGVTASTTAAKTKNPINTWVKNVIVLPNATDSTDWYGFCTSYPLKPFIYQNREAPWTELDDTEVKRNETYKFLAKMRGNAGYGLFHMGVKVVNS